MEKNFSNAVIESWNSFCNKDEKLYKDQSINEYETDKKIIRKHDGLIEKLNDKTLISEDNRQLLND